MPVRVSFQGVTDVFVTDVAFLALNK